MRQLPTEAASNEPCAKLVTKIFHVDVGSETRIVGEIPTGMIGILIEHDFIGIPHPVVCERHVRGCHCPITSPEEEAIGTATAQTPVMLGAEAAIPAAMLPRIIKVVAAIIATAVVAHPVTAVVDVRAVGMPGVIDIAAAIIAAVSALILTLICAITTLIRAICTTIVTLLRMISASVALIISTIGIAGLTPIRLGTMRRRGMAILLIVVVLGMLCPDGDSEREEGCGPYEAVRHE